MAGVKLDTVRAGVKLLSGVLKAAEQEMGNGNGKITRTELRNIKDMYGDGGSLDAALTNIVKYAQAKYGVSSPSVSQLNAALADAMRNAAKADTNKSDNLSPTEQKKLATTWKSIVDFAADYKGSRVSDVVAPRGAP